MDGRDIGTVILPNADVKFFLTADAAARAKRRTLELQAKGIAADYETVLREIEQRDANDSSRAAAPLKAADDAVLVDNSQMDQDQTVEYMCQIIEEKLG
jgi:cytidylate kinase